MATYRKIASVRDIPAGGPAVIFEMDGRSIAVWNINGAFHAYENVCPHRGGPVGEGDVEGNVVTCPWHGWTYDITTGISLVRPNAKLRRYDVKLEGDDLLVADTPS